MELAWVAAVLVLPMTAIVWKHGVSGQARTLFHGLMVVFGAMVSLSAYLVLKERGGREPDTVEKLWLAFPLFAGLVVTRRCIFARLISFLFRTRQRPQSLRAE